MGFWNKNKEDGDNESTVEDGEDIESNENVMDSSDLETIEESDTVNESDTVPDHDTVEESEEVPAGETDWKQEYHQLMAEFDNYRKRTRKDIDGARIREKVSVLKPVLEALDNFERAFSSDDSEESPWSEGIRDCYEFLLKSVTELGVEEIDALYHPFNPDYHEAIGSTPSDKLESETVAQVVQKGYQLKEGPVIRYARVIVVS